MTDLTGRSIVVTDSARGPMPMYGGPVGKPVTVASHAKDGTIRVAGDVSCPFLPDEPEVDGVTYWRFADGGDA